MSPDWPPVISTRPSASIAAAAPPRPLTIMLPIVAVNVLVAGSYSSALFEPVGVAAGDQHLAVSRVAIAAGWLRDDIMLPDRR